MTAVFDPPWKAELRNSGPVLVLAATDAHLLVVNDDGHARLTEPENVVFEMRYDWRSHTWTDVSEVWSTNEEEASPNSERPKVPGDLPDPDRTD